MNEPAIRLEEQIISLFPGMETLVCHGWILKKMEGQFLVYPLYYKFTEGNIPDNIQRCEEISRQGGRNCVFRIVEHTNYHLSGVLTDTGYTLWKCGVVCELCLTVKRHFIVASNCKLKYPLLYLIRAYSYRLWNCPRITLEPQG